jgi:hypothetical protein
MLSIDRLWANSDASRGGFGMKRSALIFFHDLTMVVLAWLGAYWLRFNLDIPSGFYPAMWSALLVVIPVQGVIFYAFGLYRGLWRFASVSDLKRILIACGIAGLASPAALVMAQQQGMVPRSVFHTRSPAAGAADGWRALYLPRLEGRTFLPAPHGRRYAGPDSRRWRYGDAPDQGTGNEPDLACRRPGR